jgi:hypothetical protein
MHRNAHHAEAHTPNHRHPPLRHTRYPLVKYEKTSRWADNSCTPLPPPSPVHGPEGKKGRAPLRPQSQPICGAEAPIKRDTTKKRLVPGQSILKRTSDGLKQFFPAASSIVLLTKTNVQYTLLQGQDTKRDVSKRVGDHLNST